MAPKTDMLASSEQPNGYVGRFVWKLHGECQFLVIRLTVVQEDYAVADDCGHAAGGERRQIMIRHWLGLVVRDMDGERFGLAGCSIERQLACIIKRQLGKSLRL